MVLGYNIYDDTKKVPSHKPVVIDGRAYRSTEAPLARDAVEWYDEKTKMVRKNNVAGYYPSGVCLQNSEYMADYRQDVVKALRKWQDQDAIVNLKQKPDFENALCNGRCEMKLTIEPLKPRVCINARPLGACIRDMPCRLDSIYQLIRYLRIGCSVIISDDSSGFYHCMLDQRCRNLMRIHYGEEKYCFNCMAFGISSAPSVYQGS